MNETLFESLLNESEGTALDFKREQYQFVGTDDTTKSELLKDILAFANSWRRTTAFILIGVDEVKGGRSKVVGISTHLNDSDLQQFVNSKTQRPLEFRYETFEYENLQIGIINIPLQKRPTFLNKKFGKLEADKVYIRRGSSTDTADLEEIIRMNSASTDDLNKNLELEILVEELSDFIKKTTDIDIYQRRIRFSVEQYQRLFDKGVITGLSSKLRQPLQQIYSEIIEVNRLVQAAWDVPRSNKWAENLNEINPKFPILHHQALSVRKVLKDYLAGE